MVYDVGIDVGSVSVKAVVIVESGDIVWEAPYIRHFGLVREEVVGVLQQIHDRFGAENVRSVSFTGAHGQRLAELLGAPYEVDTIAQVEGAAHLVPGVRTIISMGGHEACLFQLSQNGGRWYLEAFNMNGPCASGTGSFIDQQAERLASSLYGADFEMNAERLQKTLEDFIRLGLEHTHPAPVACRCTVFTKSDMIHLQNKGEPLPNIIAGLHFGNAANYVSTLVANRELHPPIVFIGGMASNPLQVKAFRHYYPEIQVPKHHTALGALGVALLAVKHGWRNRVDPAVLTSEEKPQNSSFPRGERLRLEWTRFSSENSLDPWPVVPKNPLPTFLGVDIGSTTTKYALIDEQGVIRHKCYVPTQGKPIEVTQRLLRSLCSEVGERIQIRAVATTGSGRNVVGDFLEADLVIDEITAHALGAVAVDADVDTIFEIGGQDSKYIRIERGHPRDFDMNKVCAAGTGSFLHELASKLKINIVGEFQELALSAENPIHLAERCTVFMESDLVSYAQKGARREDLIAGLCYAIVHNYLNRVVGRRHIGGRIMFLGGPSLNQGIVAAFERVLKRPLVVPRHREVMGAYGAALAVREKFHKGEVVPRQRNLEAMAAMKVTFKETICRADPKCHNECKLKVYDFGGRKSIWGGECGRYEVTHYKGAAAANLFEERRRLFEKALAGKAGSLEEATEGVDPGRPVVGIPLALHAVEWGIFWVRLLSELGFRVCLSPRTDERIVSAGLKSMTAETCFPVKVFHGHVRYLLDRVDYLFLPNVIDMPTPGPAEPGMLCPMVAGSQFMVRAALRIPDQRLIRPTIHLREGVESIADAVRRSLPAGFQPRRLPAEKAVEAAWAAAEAFRSELQERGRSVLSELPESEPLWVVTGRPYNLYDERLNLQLGRHLAKLGIQALPMDYLDVDGEDLSDFPRMYWGLGARILRVAKRIARTPNWYGVHLTNFSCGADSFIEHFYRHVMGEKPYLILELDEHSAVAGLLTRIEAYRNVVKTVHAKRFGGRVEPAEPAPAFSCLR